MNHGKSNVAITFPSTVARLSILLLLKSLAVVGDERVIWDNTPIAVQLTVDRERQIHFPGAVRYWLPDHLKTALTVMSANGVLYLQARRPFAKTRLRVQALDSRQLYLLDIASHTDGDHQATLIVTDKARVDNRSSSSSSSITSSSPAAATLPLDNNGAPVDWPVRLTRIAAQSFYAPERLLPRDTAIQRVSLDTDHPVLLLRGGDTEARPLAAWRGGGLYVTAVLIRNLSQSDITLALQPETALASDPISETAAAAPASVTGTMLSPSPSHPRTLYFERDLRGHWLTATAQHSRLTAAGTDEDRTCLYLVSRRHFSEALSFPVDREE